MKPSVKSSLPIAPILFVAVLLIGAFVESVLKQRKLARTWEQHPVYSKSAFKSDGSLVHWASVASNVPGASRYWVYDSALSERTEVTQNEINHENKLFLLLPVGQDEPDWLARRVFPLSAVYAFFGARNDLLWWNGPEGQFDLYDLQTRLRSESIGPEGIVTRAPARPLGRFRLGRVPMFLPGAYACITADDVLLLNRDAQNISLERVFHARVDYIGSLSVHDSNSVTFYLWLASGGYLWQLDHKGTTLHKISLPDQVVQTMTSSQGGIEIAPLENGGFSVEIHAFENWAKETLFLLSSDGSVLRRAEIDRDELTSRISGIPKRNGKTTMPTGQPPLLPWTMTTAALIQSLILSLVLTVIVTWHQLRRGRRGWRAFAWSAFTFLMGVIGAVCYVIAHWDKLTEPCPGCGKRRPIALDTCPHCNTPWPRPAKSGFEVLEAN
jgi:hypothetical protein